MSVFKCKMCGGALEVQNGESVAVCEYCGTKQTLPKLDDDRKANLYDRANHFRRNNDFDKAMGIYEQILNEDNTDAEAYWSIVLCRYGIEYVEDPASHKRVPTVNRAQFTSVFADEDYKSAVEHADGAQREIYEHEAKTIDEIQKGILAISQKEEPFDVFICYKETDASGRRTPDSVLATDLYHQLKQEGFKVFFSRITLEDKLGTAYEPYIFAALNSAKVMVVLGTKPEYFNAVWVKNEWSRYLALIKNGAKKVLVPAYKDMDPYDLPEEFSHLQAQDMSKLGFMQDLIRGIKKLAATEEPKATVKETVIVNNGNASNVNTASLLKRAFMFLEDEEWESADEYCEKVLDIDAENAEAYLGKLMAELCVSNKEDLSNCEYPFDGMNNYKKVLRFCDEKLHKELQEYNVIIRKRNIREYEEKHYADACGLMRDAETEEEFKEAAESFEEIIDFSDAKEKKEKCLELAEEARKQAIYDDACSFKNQQTINGYEGAILRFEQIFGFKDAEEQVAICRRKIEEIKIAEEKARIEAEHKAEAERIAAEIQAKKNKKVAAIVTPIAVIIVAVVVVFVTVIQPQNKYNAAVALMEEGRYEEAITAFEAMGDYKDAVEQIVNCENGITEREYQSAVALMEEGKYEEAIAAFEKLGDKKENETHIKDCKYNMAISFMKENKYDEAKIIFEDLNGYKDSKEQIINIRWLNTKKSLEIVGVGKYIIFGEYEQDNDNSNGKEPIEWKILDIKDDKAFVVSKYAIAYMYYDNSWKEAKTWENCDLREWLNYSFINVAFNEQEKGIIVETTVPADKNDKYGISGGNSTQDKIFILSLTEMNKYFDSYEYDFTDSLRAEKGAGVSSDLCLRTPGYDQEYVVTIDSDSGVLREGGEPLAYFKFIRPAMWIDLSAIE